MYKSYIYIHRIDIYIQIRAQHCRDANDDGSRRGEVSTWEENKENNRV